MKKKLCVKLFIYKDRLYCLMLTWALKMYGIVSVMFLNEEDDACFLHLIFNVHRSVHRKNILIYIQQDATLHNLSENCSICFGWYHHPSSGAQTTVSTASDICQTVTATCHYRGRENINVHGSVHRKKILIYIQQDATLYSLSENCSICFG